MHEEQFKLWQHANGIWYVLHGRRLRGRTSTRTRDRKTAQIFLGRFIAAQGNLTPPHATVGEILAGYRDEHIVDVKGQATMRSNVAALTEHLGTLLPEHLTAEVIKTYNKKRRVGPGTILREIGVLRAALRWAVARKWLAPHLRPEIAGPVKAPPPRDRYLSRDEAVALLAGCREPHIKLFVMLGLMTVARMSAILQAKWSQVDWQRRTIDYGSGNGNKRRALVRLNDEVYEALKGAQQIACSDYIVEFRGDPVETVKNGFRAACKRAKIEGVTPHILRHTGATWMASSGVPIQEIAAMLGDTVETTQKVYAKYTPEYQHRAAAALQLGVGAR